MDWFKLGSSPNGPDDRFPLCPIIWYKLRKVLSLYQSSRWTPDLNKILMTCGSKKGTQIYYVFLSKVPASDTPPGSPMGPLWSYPYPEPFSTHSGSPVKEPSPVALRTENRRGSRSKGHNLKPTGTHSMHGLHNHYAYRKVASYSKKRVNRR
jgi:hypothetical protein